MTVVVNLYGGPDSCKSTTAAGLFSLMKLAHHKVEIVTEHAKGLCYEGAKQRLDNQLLVFANQDQKLRRLIGQVDYIITDSPLPLSVVYSKPPFDTDWFERTVFETFATYDNVNVFLNRVKPYQRYGRTQTEDEAVKLDSDIKFLMHAFDLRVDGDSSAPSRIYDFIMSEAA